MFKPVSFSYNNVLSRSCWHGTCYYKYAYRKETHFIFTKKYNETLNICEVLKIL